MATDIVNKYINSRNPPFLANKLGSRTVEVKAVGAWVHPECFEGPIYADAMASAEAEEERIRHSKYEKEKRLKKFQDEVKKRVQKLEAVKRQQQLENSYKAIENERNIIKQSASAAEKTTSRKNRCTLRTNENSLAIRHSAPRPTSGSQRHISDDHEVDKQFEQQTNQVHRYTRAAKNKLMSKRILIDDFGRDNLPETAWSDHNSDQHESLLGRSDDKENEADNHDDVNRERSVQFDTDRLVQEITRVKSARSRSTGRSISSRSTDSQKAASVPNIYPGVENEEEKLQSVQQRAMYRRLFMDIEREQVREAQRRKTHQKKIHQLKKDKEDERKKVETASLKLLEPTDSIYDRTSHETLERERLLMELHESRQQQQRKKQRDVEATRFLEALKQTLREKISHRNIELPALCCCGVTIWDTNPDTCANNCVFYRNPKAYAKALQCVLASCDAV